MVACSKVYSSEGIFRNDINVLLEFTEEIVCVVFSEKYLGASFGINISRTWVAYGQCLSIPQLGGNLHLSYEDVFFIFMLFCDFKLVWVFWPLPGLRKYTVLLLLHGYIITIISIFLQLLIFSWQLHFGEILPSLTLIIFFGVRWNDGQKSGLPVNGSK